MSCRNAETNRYYATLYRINNREEYNEYQNNYYHQHIEQQRTYKNEWRKKKVEAARQKGIINAWDYVNHKAKPKYKEGEVNEI